MIQLMDARTPSEDALRVAALELARILDADSVFVFGSAAEGRMTSDSDVDFAVLSSRPLDAVAVFEARGRMSDLLGVPVDVVGLRGASPIVAMQVIRKGRVLVDRNPGATARFVMVVPSMYEDLKRSRAPAEAALKKRVLNAGR